MLNKTRGLYLQTLCRKIESSLEFPNEIEQLQHIISDELSGFYERKEFVQQMPNSENAYGNYLEELSSLLSEKCSAPVIESLKEKIQQETRKEFTFLFLTNEPIIFPSMETVYQAAAADQEINTALVYVPFYHNKYLEATDWYDSYVDMGLDIHRCEDFDIVDFSPDVCFFCRPHQAVPDDYKYKILRRIIPYFVFLPYGMLATKSFLHVSFHLYPEYHMWRYCVYGPIVKEYGTKYGYRNGENMVVWGHPKLDAFHDLEQKRQSIPEEWKKKIGDRKVILWTPHHRITFTDPEDTGTWLLYGDYILSEIEANPDLFFVIRPHPLIYGALKNEGLITDEEIEELKARMNGPNSLLDETTDYRNSFYASDAIITDGTTFCIEYLITGNPILLTPRNIEGFFHYEDMLNSYYIGDSKEKISDYIKMIREGRDPLAEKRHALCKSMFYFPESGTIGENIIRNTKTDLLKEVTNEEISLWKMK